VTLSFRIVAGLVLVAAALSGCADSDMAAGCTPPANESELLDAYAADPVFDVRPPQAHDVRQPTRSTACHVDPDWPDDPSQAAVSLYMQTTPGYDARALYTMYNQVATGQGWRQVQAERQESLRYCRQVRGVTSYLLISAASPSTSASGSPPHRSSPPASDPEKNGADRHHQQTERRHRAYRGSGNR
jgi:hypothetical protein